MKYKAIRVSDKAYNFLKNKAEKDGRTIVATLDRIIERKKKAETN